MSNLSSEIMLSTPEQNPVETSLIANWLFRNKKIIIGIFATSRSRNSQKRTTSLFSVASRNRVNEDHIKFMRCGHFLGGQKKQSGSGRLDIYSLQKKWKNRVYNVVKNEIKMIESR